MSEEGRGGKEVHKPWPTPQQQYWMELYQEYQEEVRRYFARRVKCPQDVEDLVQTVFLHLLVRSGDLRHPHRYVRTVARHELYTYWRRKRMSRHTENVMLVSDEEHAARVVSCDWDADPLEQLAKRERQRVVDMMITYLSPLLAEALRLRFVHDLPLSEAARRAGCSCAALKKRLTRAKQSLAGYLQAE